MGMKEMPIIKNMITTFNGVMMGCQARSFCWRKASDGGLLLLSAAGVSMAGYMRA